VRDMPCQTPASVFAGAVGRERPDAQEAASVLRWNETGKVLSGADNAVQREQGCIRSDTCGKSNRRVTVHRHRCKDPCGRNLPQIAVIRVQEKRQVRLRVSPCGHVRHVRGGFTARARGYARQHRAGPYPLRAHRHTRVQAQVEHNARGQL
jgi:hypothetical protein